MRPASKLPTRIAVFGEIRSQARRLSPSESANHGALPRLTVSPKTTRRFLPFSPRKPPCPSRQSVCAASVLNAASFEISNAQPSSAKSARRRAALALRNRQSRRAPTADRQPENGSTFSPVLATKTALPQPPKRVRRIPIECGQLRNFQRAWPSSAKSARRRAALTLQN